MKFKTATKIGLTMIAIGTILCFFGPLWTPVALVGIIIIVIGLFLWLPDSIGF